MVVRACVWVWGVMGWVGVGCVGVDVGVGVGRCVSVCG